MMRTNLLLHFSSLLLATVSLAFGQGLSPSRPAKEYIRLGGQIIAVENVPPAPTVSVTAPASGAIVSATVTLSATAQWSVGMASVQFQVDGANYGSAVAGAGPTYSISWNTATAASGAHTLTAVATDTLGQKTTSAGVAVTVAACVTSLGGRGTPAGTAPARIDLTWSALSGASSYSMFRGTASGGPYSLMGSTITTAFSNCWPRHR